MSLTTDKITQSERSLLEMRSRLTLLERLFARRANADVLHDLEVGKVHQIEGAVEEAFRTKMFNEVYPQYALRVGQHLLALSGQWLYQPSINQTAESCFEKWEVNTQFPARILVRIAPTCGIALSFRALDERIIPLSVLPISGPLRFADEVRIYPMEQGDVIKALKKVGLIGTEAQP
jgi:hypothetical protein